MTKPRQSRSTARPPATLQQEAATDAVPGTGEESQETAAPLPASANEEFSERVWKAVLSDVDRNVTDLVGEELSKLRTTYGLDDQCVLALYEPRDRIGAWFADRLISALQARNAGKAKDVVLLLRSGGGLINPAYQIAKTLKSYSAKTFRIAVPREAKSAATLMALGADEIHMGLLGELGPIDPQIDNLPALGVKRALETLAVLAQQTPGSSEMFANYLARTVRIDQIGYYERVAESAVQYAERLIRLKPALAERAIEIAKHLVYEYKDHGFVIDRDEARERFGGLIVTDSPIAKFGEAVHELLELVNLYLWVRQPRRRINVIGELVEGVWVRPYDAQ